jgi:signal transduction histidine kinase
VAVSLSVKQKLLITLWLVTFLLATLFGIMAFFWFAQQETDRIDSFLSREIHDAQTTLETFFSVNAGEGKFFDSVENTDFRIFLDRLLSQQANRRLPYKTTLGIFDTDGNRVQVSNLAMNLDDLKPEPNRDFQILESAGEKTFRAAIVPLTHNGELLGDIRLACSLPNLTETWRGIVVNLVLLLGLVFLSFGTVGSFLIHWALRPIRRMSESALQISETHLNRRLSVPVGADEVAQMAATLNRLLEKLETDFEFEEILVGQLSHELRTPLTILRTRNELSLENMDRPLDEMQQILEDNLADIDNIVSLLSTLLTLARLSGSVDPDRFTACDLVGLLQELLEELSLLWQEKSLTVDTVFPGHDPPCEVQGDPTLLRQVFTNLLTNAYKFTPAGGRLKIRLEASGSRAQPTWTLTFWNSGPPIPEESLDLIFKRFYRVEVAHPEAASDDEAPKGFGLGLSIAKTMTELQNGRIRAFNPADGGAAFEIILPQKSKRRPTQGTRRPG